VIPRGRKGEGLRNRDEMVGTGSGSWRTNTMGLGGGPQGSNLFPQAGRLTPSRKVGLMKEGKNVAKNYSDPEGCGSGLCLIVQKECPLSRSDPDAISYLSPVRDDPRI
jgi:hypothetical protein